MAGILLAGAIIGLVTGSIGLLAMLAKWVHERWTRR
jgi:hypothetical protein